MSIRDGFIELIKNLETEIELEENGEIIPEDPNQENMRNQIKSMKKSYGYDDLAWFMIYNCINNATKENSIGIDFICQEIKNFIKETCGGDIEKKLNMLGIKSKNDIILICNAMLDIEIIAGDKEPLLKQPDDKLF